MNSFGRFGSSRRRLTGWNLNDANVTYVFSKSMHNEKLSVSLNVRSVHSPN
jgi:hypothetical protein